MEFRHCTGPTGHVAAVELYGLDPAVTRLAHSILQRAALHLRFEELYCALCPAHLAEIVLASCKVSSRYWICLTRTRRCQLRQCSEASIHDQLSFGGHEDFSVYNQRSCEWPTCSHRVAR